MRRALVVAWAIGNLMASAQEWQQLPDFPGTARDDAASFSHYCKVYVGTGMEVGWNLTNDWWRYDMVQWSWQQVASLPATPRQYCTAQSINGVGYLFGGLDANAPLNELWAYDTFTDSWSERTPLPAAGRYAAASFVMGGKLYIVGGLIAGGAALAELWEYDPTMDQWAQRTDIPGAPRHRATAISGEIPFPLVIGGAAADYSPLEEVWQYGPGDSWTARTPLPEARYGLASTPLPEPIVIAGSVGDNTFRPDCYRYDWFADSWQQVPQATIPDGRRGGVSGWSDQCSGWYLGFYGLGLDSTLTRRNDWYFTGYWFGIEESAGLTLRLSPNPARDHLLLSGTSGVSMTPFELFDATGKAVMRTTTRFDGRIDIASLSPGSYRVLISDDGIRRVGHFIKLP
ncbi:MAG: T9SS type A sorting domain-containing protein [Flavobacteriales bacterium]|nr:T9SS type A sorting domain-containing protein [Flavobacteriales bacterium]